MASIQDVFLNKLRKEKIRVTVHIVNGYQINGALITGFDNFAILLDVNGKQTLAYKHAVSTVTPEKNVEFEVKSED